MQGPQTADFSRRSHPNGWHAVIVSGARLVFQARPDLFRLWNVIVAMPRLPKRVSQISARASANPVSL
jgi:hypothetical protein